MAEAPKEAAGKSPPKEAPPVPAEVPDPDEDDLDDLDDMLDEFSTTKLDSKPDAPHASGPGRPQAQDGIPPAPPQEAPELSSEDFAKQLQEQMAALMGEIDESPEMRQQVEAMMKELVAAAEAETGGAPDAKDVGSSNDKETSRKPQQADSPSTKAPPPTSTSPAPQTEDAFQQSIRKTMERMAASSSSSTTSTQAPPPTSSSSTTTNPSDDILSTLLSSLSSPSGANLNDPNASEEDFSKMLMGMMEQLTNKEILYEPMKELDTKFPAWMAKNRGTVGAQDMRRYEEQQGLVREIVARFERRGYSDDDVGDREFIVGRMQKMQAAGSPPADLVGDMGAAQEALGDLDAGCPQQ